ncbi:4975_t:CDS:2 [Funneliformis caledonium]|uniref:4975_t:CDS:1 n=1 Tax=Funneliformis caledonium TaxID=1117310 RepID=A0A9N9EJE7_9GLOM|nr:4975_t:CDS:2 [Funneliformis caledonium]
MSRYNHHYLLRSYSHSTRRDSLNYLRSCYRSRSPSIQRRRSPTRQNSRSNKSYRNADIEALSNVVKTSVESLAKSTSCRNISVSPE